jgi:chloramphenicol-sensitive protein RarD
MTPARPPEDSAGVIYATAAYTLWGFMPLYWQMLRDVPAFELTVERLLWCAVVVGIAAAVRGRFAEIMAIVRTPRTIVTLALTSVLIAINWGLYMYALLTDQLVEASLGYYLTPLVSFVLGMALFREETSRLRIFCIVLASCGVAIQLIAFGRLPWIALTLALTFGLYGYFRKRQPVAALDGLLVETWILLPITAALVVVWEIQGTGTLFDHGPRHDALLMLGGAATALPLALFGAGVRRIRLTTMGFLQYLAPSISLLLAVVAFHEPFTAGDMASFACVWIAIAVTSFEGWRARPGTSSAA